MTGRIVKSLGGFFYVRVPGEGEYECRARGIFRKENIKPLVGDVVDITVTHQGDMEGSIDAIHPRTNSLVRPPVANIDVALVVFACADPDPNLNLLDKLLVSMEVRGIDSILCF
ncbi:MAG: GTPase RsgA, partial [Eubacterium sp.]|nr:GTPase RsgA [Eubacterium sp.]